MRLPDSQDTREQGGYAERWRRFLALANLFQFCERSTAIVSSEASDDSTPGLDLVSEGALDERWQAIQEDVVVALSPFLMQMAMAGIAVPDVEVYLSDSSDCFAEIAWRLSSTMGSKGNEAPLGIALLVGDQTSFASEWQQAGWSVITLADIQAKGAAWLLSMLPIGE
jgi:DEAD/DEAH box helicase domain-containing protein